MPPPDNDRTSILGYDEDDLLYGRQVIRRILVITFPVLGDALLTTPLISALRRTYADANIDVVIRAGTQHALQGNPDIDRMLISKRRPRISESIPFIGKLLRRYDLAVSTSHTDRAAFNCLAAAPRRAAIVPERAAGRGQDLWLKARFIPHREYLDQQKHFLHQSADLLDQLGIVQGFRVTPPRDPGSQDRLTRLLGIGWKQDPMLVLQTSGGHRFKRWSRAGWASLAKNYHELGHRLIFVGGPAPAEGEYIADLVGRSGVPAENLAGLTSLADVTCLLESASLYVGIDTANSHIAAATGIPTIVLFGPTNARKWGPYPALGEHEPSPFPWSGSKTVGNVSLLRTEQPCAPYRSEDCLNGPGDRCQCLQELDVARVIAAADHLMSTAHRDRLAAGVQPERERPSVGWSKSNDHRAS